MDTRDIFKRLKSGGLSDEAADAIVDVIRAHLIGKTDADRMEERIESRTERKVGRLEVRVLGFVVLAVVLSGTLWKFIFGV